MKNYYKVVKKVEIKKRFLFFSYRYIYYCSAIAGFEAKVKYKKNKWAKAPKWLAEKNYHLTCFESLNSAMQFKCFRKSRFIFKCKIKDKIDKKPQVGSWDSIRFGNLMMALTLPPLKWFYNTIMAKKIMIYGKPIE